MVLTDPRETAPADPESHLTDDDDTPATMSRIAELEAQLADLKQRVAQPPASPPPSVALVPPSPEQKAPATSFRPRAAAFTTEPVVVPPLVLKPYRTAVTGIDFASELRGSREEHRTSHNHHEALTRDRVWSFCDETPVMKTHPVDERDPFSGLRLSLRHLPALVVERLMRGKKALRLDKLCAKVAPPEYEAPQYPNWVVVAIVTAKSEPKEAGDGRGKYMKLTLSDFSITIELMLFGEAFNKYWKTLVGNVVAVLNPDIWRFKPTTQGYKMFNLSLKGDLNGLLEIGRARDFGACPAVKRNGQVCGIPLNRTKELHCHFHVELAFRKTAGKRMEFNSAVSMFGPGSTVGGIRRQDQVFMGGNVNKGFKGKLAKDPYAPKVDAYDGSLRYFSNPNAGKAFFDDEFQNPDILANIEGKRRKVQDNAAEVALRRKLARILGGSSLTNNIEDDEPTRAAKSKIAQTAFNPHVLNKIGFNPIRRLNEANVSSEVSKSALSRELDTLRAHPNKSTLKAPKSERVAKKRAWDETMNQARDYAHRGLLKGKYGDDFGDVNFSDSFDDSESELEIEFENPERRAAYQKVIQKNPGTDRA